MKPKRWQLSTVPNYEIAGLSRTLTSVLQNRGFHGLEDMSGFLAVSLENLESPFLLPDMHKAVLRLEMAIAQKQAIWIYGDYDVDGMTSTAIVYRVLEHLGANVHFYIPKRLEEGYGLNSEAMSFLASEGASVIVTVDCGISAIAEAALCQTLGVDLIITDHHECQDQLPQAYALINPKLPNCHYPYEMLAGAGIALKLAQALLGDQFNGHTGIGPKLLALSAIGTIADVAPLTGENRIIASHGLAALSDSKMAGLEALIKVCKLDGKPITAGHVGFMIGPRLNAVGRLEHAQAGVELLLTDDPVKAFEIASNLDALNQERQETERKILEAALKKIESEAIHMQSGTIIVWGPNWHTGVVGIVASRLVERFYRPVIVLSEVDGLLKGSARSIAGYSIFEALLSQNQWLKKFGGHEQAAGLTLESENLPALIAGISKYNQDHLTPDILIETIKCDARLTSKEIHSQLVQELSQLEPFGMGNPKPVFRLDHLKVEETRRMGKDQSHLKIKLNNHYRLFEALQFKFGDRTTPIKGCRMDVALQLDINTFNGVESVQLLLKDFRSYDPNYQFFQKKLYVRYIQALFAWVVERPLVKMEQNFSEMMPNERRSEDTAFWIDCEETLGIWSFEGLLEVAYACHDMGLDLDDLWGRSVQVCPQEMLFGAICVDLPFDSGQAASVQTVGMRRLDHVASETILGELTFDRSHAAQLFGKIKKERILNLELELLGSQWPVKDLVTLLFFEEAGFVIKQGGDYVLTAGPHQKMAYEESQLYARIELLSQGILGMMQYMKNHREL